MLLFFFCVSNMCLAQVTSKGLRSVVNDTATYFLRLSSKNPFTIDSITSASTGRRLDFFSLSDPAKSCSSIVCDTGTFVIAFRQMELMRPLEDERRVALNSQVQPTHDYQKGVVVFTRHGKKFRRIAITSFMEVAPGDPNLLPSVVRPPVPGF